MAMTEYLILLYDIATLSDHVSTNIVLKRGGHEKNPFLAKVIERWGSAGLFFAKAVLFAAVYGYHQFVAPIADWMWIAGSVAFFGIAAMNVKVVIAQETQNAA